jgi:hypothetical protein
MAKTREAITFGCAGVIVVMRKPFLPTVWFKAKRSLVDVVVINFMI